jgi:hypothetical protein
VAPKALVASKETTVLKVPEVHKVPKEAKVLVV